MEILEEARFTYDYLNRTSKGVHNVTYKLPNLNDLVWGQTDYVAKKCESDLRINFDFKHLKISLITLEDYVDLIFKVENNRVHKIPRLDAQVRAGLGHLRLYHRTLVDECVTKHGLQVVLRAFKTCIEHSVEALTDRPQGYENKAYSAEWLLKPTSWKHLPDSVQARKLSWICGVD